LQTKAVLAVEAVLVVLLIGTASLQLDASTKEATMAIHMVINRALLAYGFDIFEATVGDDGIHRFLVADRDDGRQYYLSGRASLEEVKPLREASTFAQRTDATLESEDGALRVQISQTAELWDNGRIYCSRLTAMQVQDGLVPLDGILSENQVIELVEGDTDLASIGEHLADAGRGASVDFTTRTTTMQGERKTTSLGHVRIAAQGDGKAIAESVITAVDHYAFVAVTTQEKRLICVTDCGEGDAPALLDSTMNLGFWGFDVAANEPVHSASEFALVDWDTQTSSEETHSATRHATYTLGSADGGDALVINQGNTTTVDGAQIRNRSYQEVLLNGTPRAFTVRVTTIDPEECPPGEIRVGDENGSYWCMPSGEAQPITAWDFAAFISVYGKVAHVGVSFGSAVLQVLGVKVGVSTLLEGLSSLPEAPDEESPSSVPSCDQKVDIWTCRSPTAMNALRQGYALSLGSHQQLAPTLMSKDLLPQVDPKPEDRPAASGISKREDYGCCPDCAAGTVELVSVSPRSGTTLRKSADVEFRVSVRYTFEGASTGWVGVYLTGSRSGGSSTPIGCDHGIRECCAFRVSPGSGTLTFTATKSMDWIAEEYGSTIYLELTIGCYEGGSCYHCERCDNIVLTSVFYRIE